MKKLQLMGRKRGMTQLFDNNGNNVPCTVIEIEPNVITQVKQKETDGYEAVQTSFETIKVKDPRTLEKRLAKPQQGLYKKGGIAPRKFLCETRVDAASEYAVGQEITVDSYKEILWVAITSISKGKGYQGVMKKYNFKGGPGAHGSGFHRHAGSTGMRTTPGRCLPGGKRASRMGGDQVTVHNEIFRVDADKKLIIVKGCVPGSNGSLVWINTASKKKQTKKK